MHRACSTDEDIFRLYDEVERLKLENAGLKEELKLAKMELDCVKDLFYFKRILLHKTVTK